MPRLTSLHIFFFLLIAAVCQSQKIESLKELLSSSELTTADSIDLLDEIGYEYWTADPQQSLIFGRKSLGLSPRINHPKGKAFSHRVIGVALWALGDYPLALENMIPDEVWNTMRMEN